ncbi:MAG: YbaN family protein [Rhizobiaceae bacterium]
MSARFHNQKTKMSNQVISRGKKIVWIVVGLIALLLGFIGVFLPILPTTPFVIVAAFAFGKSIPAWRRWLVNNKIFGPIIADWEETGAIAPRYKAMATLMMLAALALSFYLSIMPAIIVVQALCMLAAFTFIITRPNGTP